MYRQRYPAAGTANTQVELKVLELASGKVDAGRSRSWATAICARVDWFPDSKHLAVQRQTRDQKRLDLLKVDVASGRSQVLLTETSPNWVELHNDLHFLEAPAGVHVELAALRLQASVSVRSRRQAAAPADRGRVDGRRRRHRERPGRRRRAARQRLLPGERSRRRWNASSTSTSLDTRAAGSVTQRLSREAGWHDAKLLPGATRLPRSVLVARSAADREPAQARRLAAALAACATRSTTRIPITSTWRITSRKSSARSRPQTASS